MAIQLLSKAEVLEKLARGETHDARLNYLAMYSSWLGGITTEPVFMSVPIDDHMVHRGDGVFEAMKCIDGRIYALDRHLDRLAVSAEKIALKWPVAREVLREICLATVRAAGDSGKNSLLRLYLSRGPGSFSVSPYDTIAGQIYLVVTRLREASPEMHARGVTCLTSAVAVKPGDFATVKSCNYLQNVLMKKEALDAGVDFTVSLDERGAVAEGSTENFAIVSSGGELLVPSFDRTLRGVTLVRAMELAQGLVASGELKGVRQVSFNPAEVRGAREAMLLGTTLDCLGVATFDGQKIGDGKPGPVTCALHRLLRADMESGPLAVSVASEKPRA